MQQKAYIVKHKDAEVRMASRSGGVFTAVSDIVLMEKGVVYGCAVNEQFQAEHIRAASKEERNQLRGSKYVQSSVGNCYKKVRDDLASGQQVLFSGTGCQVAGVKSYLGGGLENLLTIDIVCHGVPSPAVWKSFLEWMENKYRGKVSSVNFRDKRYGWMAHFESVIIKGRIRVADYYRAIFYKHFSLRPCCFKCPYANTNRISDITIADAWGVDRKHSFFNDDKGVSLVILNTEKGISYFERAKEKLEVIEVQLDEYMQPNLRNSSNCPEDRARFWNDFVERGFEYVGYKYGDNTLKGNVKSIIKRILGRTRLTRLVKKFIGK